MHCSLGHTSPLQIEQGQHGPAGIEPFNHKMIIGRIWEHLDLHQCLFPKTGTMLMQSSPMLAIDLPLKAMVWQDDGGKTCVTYYDPVWLAAHHALPANLGELAVAMRAGVKDIVQHATQDTRVAAAEG